MSGVSAIIADNVHLLKQGTLLLRGLNDAIYSDNQSSFFDSGVGRHVRHTLDHYWLFLSSCPDSVDYDDRARDQEVEENRVQAVEMFQRVIDQLNEFSEDLGRPLDVQHNGRWSRSTIGRELQHLSNHTLHHYALIAMILRSRNVEVVEDFGVAPSTLAYRRTQNDNQEL